MSDFPHPLRGIPMPQDVRGADGTFTVTMTGREVLMLARGLRILAEICAGRLPDEAIEAWEPYVLTAADKLQDCQERSA